MQWNWQQGHIIISKGYNGNNFRSLSQPESDFYLSSIEINGCTLQVPGKVLTTIFIYCFLYELCENINKFIGFYWK